MKKAYGKGGQAVDIYTTINGVLVKLFRDVMHLEEKAVITGEFKDISNNDMHIIEAIGVNEPKNMSQVAKALSVTVGTLTIAMNSLVKKGYVTRVRSEKDRRVVLLSLSEKGKEAYNHHKEFHRKMVESTIERLSGEEKEVLVKALQNLYQYFQEL